VLLRDPFIPVLPALHQAITAPFTSVIETIVLLNVALIYAIPDGTVRKLRLFTFFTGTADASVEAPATDAGADLSGEPDAAPSLVAALFSVSSAISFLSFKPQLLLISYGFPNFFTANNTNSPLRSFSSARIRAGSLASDRQTFSMPTTSVTADADQTANILRNFSPKITFHTILSLYYANQTPQLIGCQIISFFGLNLCFGQNGLGTRKSYSIYIAKGILNTFLPRDINTKQSRHMQLPPVTPASVCAWG
jgi:hypothetical protein